MVNHNLTCFLLVLLISHVYGASRNKRCIVVQKQSGTHGDSSEGDDDDRSTQPRDPRPDRRRTLDPLENVHDVEDITPNLLKYQILPTKRYLGDIRRLKNRFYRTN